MKTEKMNVNSMKYLLIEGLKNVLNNRLMALASIGVLTACLLVVGCSVLLAGNMNTMVTYIGEKSTMVVFLKDGSDNSEVNDLLTTFKNNKNVKSVEYVSKDQALLNYSRKLNSDEMIQALREDNVLPASLNVHITNMDNLDEVWNIAKKSDIVENISVPTNITDMIRELGHTIGWFGTIVTIALVLVSLVIISNTIRATVFARRREIGIMKQVGATDNFVRFPFLVEGMSIGVFSAMLAFVLVWFGYETIFVVLTESTSAFLKSMFSSVISFGSIGWIIAVGFLFGGMLAGAAGSLISLRKYLNV